jgi:methylase of polypeptide subunit release factors
MQIAGNGALKWRLRREPMSTGLIEARRRVEYGDFQTPPELTDAVCRVLARERPATLIEPTCGTGTFLAAALARFRRVRSALGIDINPQYVTAARRAASRSSSTAECRVRAADFFQIDWPTIVGEGAEPLLILGNPPWVTNSVQGVLGGRNLPPKQNLPGRSGLDGLTGKSNFDVSEWMIYRLLEAVAGRRATLAMLCKTAVARRVLARAWETRLPLQSCEIRAVDALRHFGARVDACLLVCRATNSGDSCVDCHAFDDLDGRQSTRVLGWRDGRLVADVDAYRRVKPLLGGHAQARWRSGIKHDCAAVFEFREEADGTLVNGQGEAVDLEDDYLFPLVKSSDIAGNGAATRRRVLVPQRRVGQETDSISRRAPKTWHYLQRHAARLDRRASRVYQKQPRFSIFGVGPYTFGRWKVVVSGFYKKPHFVAVGPVGGRPVVCDDTCYFLPCETPEEARTLADLLNSTLARDFFSAFVFPDAKRPLTAEILGSLDLTALVAAQTG